MAFNTRFIGLMNLTLLVLCSRMCGENVHLKWNLYVKYVWNKSLLVKNVLKIKVNKLFNMHLNVLVKVTDFSKSSTDAFM